MRKTLKIVLVCLLLFLGWRMVRPLNIFVVDEKFATPISTTVPANLHTLSARECGTCHEAIYAEWRESMHAKAWTDEYFQVDHAYDGSQPVCLNCHTPLEDQQRHLTTGFRDKGMFDPILETNPRFDPRLQEEGVTCAACHVKDGVIIGPFGSPYAPHPVKKDPEMSSGLKYCRRCHVVEGKGWDTFYRIPPCGTVAEIAEGGEKPDCVGCHMPETMRPIVMHAPATAGRRHSFQGGHAPGMVKKALSVETEIKDTLYGKALILTLENMGAFHYLPTGTPDRHLAVHMMLLDGKGKTLKEKSHTLKRFILWRPFIADVYDSRLPFGEPREFVFRFGVGGLNPPRALEVSVDYGLVGEARRKRIGWENKTPISYPLFRKRIPLE